MRNLRCALIACGLFYVVFTSFAQAAGFRVTFVNPGGEEGFWGHVTKTMQAAAADFDIELEVLHANRRPYHMENLLRERLLRGDLPDYVILVNELQEGARLVQMLYDLPVRAIFLLNTLTETQINVLEEQLRGTIIGSITPNNEAAGYEMAQSLFALDNLRPGSGRRLRMLALTGDDSTPAALDRQKGMERAVAEAQTIDLLGAIPVNWNGEVAYERAKAFLRRTEVDLVWAANDDIAMGAARAAQELGFVPGKDIRLVGLNWSKAGMEAVRNRQLTMTHGGHFFAGAWVTVMLYDYHFGGEKPVVEDVLFEMSSITLANVSLFLDRLGDEDWDRIDFRRFSRVVSGGDQYDFSTSAILEAASD